MIVMLSLKVPDWLNLVTTIVALATFGWTVWKEVAAQRLSRRMRITAGVEDCPGGNVVTIVFSGAETHTYYQAEIQLIEPKAAFLSYGKLIPAESSSSFIAGRMRRVPDGNLGRRAPLHLDIARKLAEDQRANEIVIVTNGKPGRAVIRVKVLDKPGRRVVASRKLALMLL